MNKRLDWGHQFVLNRQTYEARDFPLLFEGGEGWILDIGHIRPGHVLKLFKTWRDYGREPEARKAADMAEVRIGEYASKLKAMKNLPDQVVRPVDIAWQPGTGDQVVAGFTMEFVKGAVNLEMLGNLEWRRQHGFDSSRIMFVFQELAKLVADLHSRGYVIGDFKPGNILVKDNRIYLIDAESMQFGNFKCHGFTENYVDPLICEETLNSSMEPVRPFSTASDWFSYAAIFLESLIGLSPFGGMLLPRRGEKMIPKELRPLKGLSVFRPGVKIPPRVGRPSDLPQILQDYFRSVFEAGVRVKPGDSLFAISDWVYCESCKIEHVPQACPRCGVKTLHPSASSVSITISPVESTGMVVGTRNFAGKGDLICIRNGKLEVSDRVVVEEMPQPYSGAVLAGREFLVMVNRKNVFRLGINGGLPIADRVEMDLNVEQAVAMDGEDVFFVRDRQLVRITPGGRTYNRGIPEGSFVFAVKNGKVLFVSSYYGRTVFHLLDYDQGRYQELSGLPELNGNIQEARVWVSGKHFMVALRFARPQATGGSQAFLLLEENGRLKGSLNGDQLSVSNLKAMTLLCEVGNKPVFVTVDDGHVTVFSVKWTTILEKLASVPISAPSGSPRLLPYGSELVLVASDEPGNGSSVQKINVAGI